jgi:hypothetical protein
MMPLWRSCVSSPTISVALAILLGWNEFQNTLGRFGRSHEQRQAEAPMAAHSVICCPDLFAQR